MTQEKNDSNKDVHLEEMVKNHSLERVKAFLSTEKDDREKKRMLQLAQLFAVEHGKHLILEGLHDLGAKVDMQGDAILFALASLPEETNPSYSSSPHGLLATHVKTTQRQIVLFDLLHAIGIQDEDDWVNVSKELTSILTKSKIRNRDDLFLRWGKKKIEKRIHDLLLSYKKPSDAVQKPMPHP